ncbi:uncharacterized protein HMPREF1541_00613 [Cyphellophora europaea CBS 101466]|uniref:Pyroglutamyl-peptidase I n=1 Tax=Cyphellophora europaea (strain CBS 101466) TaxID=1220924 RepID=W2SEX0_CYPE1|nr:uncharacterized protein HMPREF1541_00613 [Cyphellophora europaea CBS 101466]ETN46429.1 hypothetical protein HMPREF1541_00613 [Cyphellophora europaea CBS 101466]
MGDAGPLTPPLTAEEPLIGAAGAGHETDVREVTVLVTGFGPFKSFAINPSYLIASALPATLASQPPPSKPVATNNDTNIPVPPTSAYRIRLISHPTAIRVAYATVVTILPTLTAQHTPDYIFHIGMAGGRDHYTLETVAHRDNYKIKDVDERDGWKDGEYAWKKAGLPSALHVGWDEADVCERWEREVREREEELGLLDPHAEPAPQGSRGAEAVSAAAAAATPRYGEWGREVRRRLRSVCRLSTDAGRFLCEFTLFESLGRRWLEARGKLDKQGEEQENRENKEGKVAFLHVPGAFGPEDVERGVRVATAAIRSLVGSWEEGRRRKYEQEAMLEGKMEGGKWDGVVWRA